MHSFRSIASTRPPRRGYILRKRGLKNPLLFLFFLAVVAVVVVSVGVVWDTLDLCVVFGRSFFLLFLSIFIFSVFLCV
jgi:hypothetical protein